MRRVRSRGDRRPRAHQRDRQGLRLHRKFSDIAFAAEVATLIGADETFAEIVRDHALDPDKLAFYAPMFEARYKSITQLIGECGATGDRLPDHLGLSPAVIERMRAVLRVWVIELARPTT